MQQAGLLKHKEQIVSTPYETKDIREVETVIEPQEETEEDKKAKQQAKLRERMHLATGAEKKKIMKDLKLGFTTKGEHPWAKAMSQKGLLVPGAKWWAPQSESFFRR
jgi:hypothetical protein